MVLLLWSGTYQYVHIMSTCQHVRKSETHHMYHVIMMILIFPQTLIKGSS